MKYFVLLNHMLFQTVNFSVEKTPTRIYIQLTVYSDHVKFQKSWIFGLLCAVLQDLWSHSVAFY